MAGILGTFVKQPADELDYDLDFTEWLADADPADTLQAAESALISNHTPATLVLGPTIIFGDDKQVKIWVSAGADGELGKVATTITTTNGRTKQVDWRVRVREFS